LRWLASSIFAASKAIGLLLLTVLAILLVNSRFLQLSGFSQDNPHAIFFSSHWQVPAFVMIIVLALVWSFCSRWLVCFFMKVKMVEINSSDYALLHLEKLLKRLAGQQGIASPRLGVYQSSEINAFTTGFTQGQAIIVVSRGLLQGLTMDEQEAVIAHELTHITNHDMLNLTLMQSVLNVLVMVPSHLVSWLLDKKILGLKQPRGPAYWLVWLALQAMYGLLATILVMWFSRWREFRADRGAARMVGYQRMQTVLTCLKESRRQQALPGELGSFAISGPIGIGVQRLFSTHPPLSERIAALKEDW
jgi:heat shock protein HtpX